MNDPNAYRPAAAVKTPSNSSTSSLVANNTPAVMAKEVNPNGLPLTYGTSFQIKGGAVNPALSTTVAPRLYEAAASPAVVRGNYAIQIAAYGNTTNAERQVAALRSQGLSNVFVNSVTKSDGSTLNRVLVGPFVELTDAQVQNSLLQKDRNLAGIVTQLR
ncbi:MAG: SPOR domain-containing protein [Lewinella sp.]|nr:SPOR domain-containing protein [Lewinella sp.]